MKAILVKYVFGKIKLKKNLKQCFLWEQVGDFKFCKGWLFPMYNP